MTRVTTFVFATWIAFGALSSWAQILPREDDKAGLEELYDQYENVEDQQKSKKQKEDMQRQSEGERRAEKELNKLSELSELAPFDDIAVIQRRFLPKTSRFELSGSLITSTNNQYFSNFGIDARIGFYFQEKYGIEGIAKYVTSSERPITQGLVDNQNIQTDSLVQPTGYYGAAFKWTPVYGKIAWFQHKIIPFDLFFTPGFGITTTKDSGSNPTFSLGIGQLFALTKSFGVRWDFNWNTYSADVTVEGSTQSKSHSDLFLGIGVSYFIPEATYR